MASAQAHLDKAENRKFFQNLWRTDLMGTLKADPPFWCFALWCGPCSSYVLRKRALYGDMTRYKCCAGYMPCSGKCGESRCPEFCLVAEVCCCFGNSVSSTRFLLQDEFNIRTTKCDNCIIGFMIVLGQLACLCRIAACLTGDEGLEDAAHILTCLSDMVYYSVCACMQTQHKVELDKRDGKFGDPSPMSIPPVQQMSRIDQPYGPTVGYPPAYGAPYGQPQPPHQGYPASAPPLAPAQAPGFPPPSASAYPPPGPGAYPPPSASAYPPPGPGPYPPQQQPGYWR
uniref:Putative collagen alpha-1(III) chain-like n=2 Tax=Solanum chacoense TaxID=4108 RepID=A0A0V0HX73_SOLCH